MRHFITATLLALSFSASAATQVAIETSLGEFVVELNEEQAPVTTKNFLRYVEDGSYVGTIFHRVIPGFMAQGGGFDADLQQRQSYEPIKNESDNGLSNQRATIAMARTQVADSATRQFYINYQNNTFLDGRSGKPGYAVFGKVVKGFSVIEKMAAIPTTTVRSIGMKDVPQQPIVIKAINLINK
ncbi:peptidyl-prolyl cis-trans isomerase [Photobacterium halotolerans]|uniref:peptidylprolyl isomerase n=1 Tax=Photobacterium halotolerans TaxID=265726 RepID=UPI001372611F|nr:peptidylprolyl isomerase [Photobacterium halotolerans]NAX47075.1 peptidyl-prolyl cis-trans isomerase [Photobacterium halotolerans]